MNPKTCPTCHAAIPESAPGGFCPACLLRDAEEIPPAGRAAPSLEEIAAAFPQWKIVRLIGQGGMGFVYQARQPSLDRTVALKILAPELGRDPAFAERFAREARTLGKLHHPNIVTVFEHGESAGYFYLLMEYVDGVNLRQAMRAGRFTPEQALALVPPICDALQAAHAQGVWHRDIKPENILLDTRGGVKIADFGIARLVGDPQRDFTLTMTGGALGSAAYMAPEQHENPRNVDHRADIYSLGVVIYEMLTGELPLGRFPAPSQRAAVNARIDEIVFRTLEKEREMRQQSAEEVKTEVQGAAESVPTSVRMSRLVHLLIAFLIVCGLFGTSYWPVSSRASAATSAETRELHRLEQIAIMSPDLLSKPETVFALAEKGWNRPVAFVLDHTDSPELVEQALLAAASAGHRSLVRMILDRGIDIKGSAVSAALVFAVENHNIEIVRELLDSGADPDGKVAGETPRYATPLVVAARRNFTEIAQILIDAGADVNLMPVHCLPCLPANSTFYIGAPLHEAVWFNQPEMMELLLKYHANVNLAETRTKITPLWLAAWQNRTGNPTMVKRLLELGADPDAESATAPEPRIETWLDYPGKSTPVGRALVAGSVPCVRLLLEAKAERQTPVKSIWLRDAVAIADANSAFEITRLLLDHGANPNAPDPLYEMVVKMKDAGGPVTLLENESLVQLAASKTRTDHPEGSWKIIKLLLERGAKVDPEWQRKGFYGAKPEIRQRLNDGFSGSKPNN